ncbi:hypothetical protein [Microtetraspora sp. NBRC 16547]|uniref:hypothetical protein n=1 Tax=Microtetraspora sp. NBRC 16547 TaxID=3030993 RepID=UPI002555E701|nr:hypothetical protein [Microtetraspora sp. NBRC 16547]
MPPGQQRAPSRRRRYRHRERPQDRPERPAINERKATVLLDTSRAFLAWGKHDRALYVLRAAGDIAPEEITGRPATLRLVRDILATAPITVRREARESAEALGVSA